MKCGLCGAPADFRTVRSAEPLTPEVGKSLARELQDRADFPPAFFHFDLESTTPKVPDGIAYKPRHYCLECFLVTELQE